MAAHRQSPYLPITRALLTGGAILALVRVYSGASWLFPLLLAAFIPGALFALGERRRGKTVTTVAVALVVGAWLAIVVDDPSETVAGLPSISALSTAAHDLTRAPHVLRSAVVPVAPIGAALMLAVIATFVAALATELIARRLEAPVGAIGPSVALFVAISALGSGRWAPTTACYALVVIQYLVALQHADMQTRRTWFQSPLHRRSQLVSGGAIAGVLVVAAAIALGPGVPGARGKAWIQYRSLGTGSGSNVLNVTSPLVSVRAKLDGKQSAREVFRVKTTEATGNYWRVIALDQFQDDGWGLNSDQRSASNLPGPTGLPGTTLVTQQFHLADIDARWLPAAYRPVKIDVPGSQVLPGSTSLFLDDPLKGLDYVVQSEIANPDESLLRAVSPGELQAMSADLALPSTFSGRARGYAQLVTAEAVTPYDKAIALMKSFQSAPFTYDTSIDLGTTTNTLEKFLFETHKGFCEQYAAAFAELARSVGLPTRVAVGYQRGQLGQDGFWHVQEKDAHAWPEVWLGPNVGWYRFEPTPGRTDPVTGLGSAGTGTGATTTTTTVPKDNVSTPSTASLTPTSLQSRLPERESTSSTGSSGTRTHVITALFVAIAVALAGFVVFVGALVIHALLRTRRRRHDPDERRRVLGAWTEALEQLDAAGIKRRPATTSLEFALRQAPRSARATRARRSWTSPGCIPLRSTPPTRPRRPKPTKRGPRSTRFQPHSATRCPGRVVGKPAGMPPYSRPTVAGR